MKPIDRDRPTVKKAADAMRAALRAFFLKAAQSLADQIAPQLGKLDKADADMSALEDERARRVQAILESLDLSYWDELPGEVEKYLVIVAKDGAKESLLQLNDAAPGIDDDAFKQANEQAVEWAEDRSAELVGKKLVDGEWIDNPNALWQIDTDTRDAIRDTVSQAMEEGWSNDTLAKQLGDDHAFSDERAEMIARTETARADVQGTLIGYSASGVVSGKEWLTAPDCCDLCQELDKEVVGLGEQFPNDGGDGPPLHPQCRCDVLPVLSEQQENEE